MAKADRLEAYRARRDFSRTPEPAPGGTRKAGGARTYTVQKHAARRLHFDLRLEHAGVLLSFAVTRGPSLDPSQKRLAVRTEDHPLDYATFEGTIPEGEYGGGTVMLWDRGSWTPHGDPEAGLERGKLSFRLDGERLAGDFALVRMKPKGRERRENWLLVKERDGREDPEADPVAAFTTSIASGRTMEAIARADAPAEGARAGRPGPGKPAARRTGGVRPAFVKPALATLVDAPPAGEGHLHEIKYDGYRIVAVRDGARVRIFTRSGKDWTDRFGGIAAAVAGLAASRAVLDGEAVAFNADGHTDFSSLQKALSEGGEIGAYLFDCLHLDGDDLAGRPLRERKAALRALLGKGAGPLRYSDHVEGNGAAVFRNACRLGVEGIVSKRADAPYRSGRARSWTKTKCVREEEVVIGGFSRSDVRGKPFASLLVGTLEDGRLVYRGKVGTGFSAARAEELARLFDRRTRKTSPFHDLPREAARGATFLTPDLPAVVRYAELTADGVLRHAAFRGLREDKPPRAVSRSAERGREAAMETAEAAAGPRLTNPDKVLFPAAGLTKKGLFDYLETVADRMLPHVADRPLTLVRCPEGRQKACFFQKHHTAGLPPGLAPLPIAEKGGGKEPYLVIRDRSGLAACAQVGALELHVWGARADAVDRPDRLVFDLDPDEGVAFADLKAAAREVRDLLAAAGLPSFALLTGGKGIHVIVPLSGRATWEAVKPFAREVATRLARAAPDRYVAKASKAARKGRIFVDWLRNARGATAIAPYSVRARENAPVATPVRWDELGRIAGADAYTAATLPRRLARLHADPWKGFEDARVDLAPDHARALQGAGG